LERNLEQLFNQDYEEYEITFVAESRSDPCCELIERVMSRNRQICSRLVIAGRADADGENISGQKVHNLRFATKDLSPDIDFLVFVDSDAQPRREWLRAIIGRLGRRQRTTMGASTGYRWMIPTRPTLSNLILYSVNCGITSLLGSRERNQVWGGSWALRRETFEATDLRHKWSGTLSDDFVAAQVLNAQGRPVKYEPACLVPSPVDNSFRETFSFLRRQYLIARFYVPLWWTLGLATVTITNLIWPASFVAIFVGLLGGSPMAWLPMAVLATVYGLGVYRGWMRQSLIKIHFPHLEETLRVARLFDIWAGPLAAAAHWLALISASFGRTITWRNITYRLHRGGRVEMVSQGAPVRLRTFGDERQDEPEHLDTIAAPVAEADINRQKAA
jgi:cellulose synthase/poly-beta-1,6-N-acetylglucosamine synthase-like glycosyltransferase